MTVTAIMKALREVVTQRWAVLRLRIVTMVQREAKPGLRQLRQALQDQKLEAITDLEIPALSVRYQALSI